MYRHTEKAAATNRQVWRRDRPCGLSHGIKSHSARGKAVARKICPASTGSCPMSRLRRHPLVELDAAHTSARNIVTSVSRWKSSKCRSVSAASASEATPNSAAPATAMAQITHASDRRNPGPARLPNNGIDGIMQPRMDYDASYCNYSCNVCSHICPTGAIMAISVDEKKVTQIGKAKF